MNEHDQNIQNNYGYKKFYWIEPIVSNIKSIRNRMLENTEILYLSERDFATLAFEELAKKEKSIYLSLNINKNDKSLVAGSSRNFLNHYFFAMKNGNYEKLDQISQDRAKEIASWKDISNINYAKRLAMKQFEPEQQELINLLIFNVTHNVVMKIDFVNQMVFYKDSFGHNIPSHLREILESRLPDYIIMADQSAQQHHEDHSNCSIFATYNLQTLISHRSCEAPIYLSLPADTYIEKIEKMRDEISTILEDIHQETKEKNLDNRVICN